ncbi:MAG: hypothetical protein SFW66_00255 [Gammaproteobacteria bacterium]|nr:hypothetical protein [Gammaproteobacteria bacterium]
MRSIQKNIYQAYNYFLGKKPSYYPRTRFDKSRELKEIREIIGELRSKKDQLNKEIDGNASAEGYIKCTIITSLIQQIDREIVQFNMFTPKNEEQDKNETLEFAQKLSKIVRKTIETYTDTLKSERNDKKLFAKTAISSTTSAAAVALGWLTSSYLVGWGSFKASGFIDEKIFSITGLNTEAASYRLILNLSRKLYTLEEQLRFVLELEKLDEAEQHNIICPLTKKVPLNPVTCLIDNIVYDKEEIVKWLTEKGSTPNTRMPIPQGKSIPDVLCENPSLKMALDDLRNEKNRTSRLASALEDEEKEEEPAYRRYMS